MSVKHDIRWHYLKKIPLHCNDFATSVEEVLTKLKIVFIKIAFSHYSIKTLYCVKILNTLLVKEYMVYILWYIYGIYGIYII